MQRTASTSLLIAIGFFSLLAVSALLGRLPIAIVASYGALSLITFLLYYLDKSAARRGARRIPENTLHLFALLGGWPGALIGQQRLRHKTRKQPFRTLFWLTACANLALLTWLHSADAAPYRHAINETTSQLIRQLR